ncbi:MAG: HTH domain-containing protein, partial [Gammaproteobacteria bacterium]|nr:HTH domain-containing protein [Gammaproteobacteria bacterium]
MQLRKHLLKQLSDGEFHSGEALGEALGVTRMAVWKHLKALRETGITIEVVRGKGYRLPAPVELLDERCILSAVTAETRARLGPVEVLLEVDSTNNRLREQALKGAPSGAVCVAEQQTAGRGRQGRTWVSPFAENLYLS